MKKFFKKSLNILMALMTLVNMFIEPICVLASEPVKGDLAYGDQYVRENNGSVNVVDGAFVNEGDVEVRKTVTKLDSNGNYEVKFEVRGKNYSKTTPNTKDIYAVIVFDRSNSMTEGNNKWSNAKNAARAFAEGLIEKYSKANIAVVTFGTTAKTTQEFTNSNLKNISDNKLFGEEPNGGNAGATNLHAGLEKAKTLLSNIDKDAKDKDAKKYVVVISDGAPTKYKVNGSGGNGGTTSYDCIDKAVTSAKDLKTGGAEIFTVGYDLSSEIIYKGGDIIDRWGNVIRTDSYKNSTAESILKLIATDASHYVSSDQDNIVDKLKDIASSTTVYLPAGTNLTITDNIGSSFTSSDDTDNDGKIVLNTVKKITEEWQEAGRFNITINENSTTDWHNTNDNFSYSYTDKVNGKEVNKTCTKNPVVYWVQPEYGYTIEYYYSNVKDESKTVTGNSHEGKTVFVTDEMIEANNKIGYKSVNVIPKSKSIEIKKDTSLNVIKVYYDIDATQLKNLKYTVRYFKDGVLQEKDTINKTKTVQVLESNYINVDLNEINTTDMYTGYKFDHSKPAVIPASVETGTVIDIYYVKDDSQKVEVKYTVEYYVDGVKQENDTQVGRKDIWVNATKELEVNPNHINTTNKYTGYKFDHSDPETIPSVVADGTVIKIYYVKDDSQKVEVKYTVEYYVDGVLQENDTKVDTKNIWINATKELEVNSNYINTTDKYTGYKFDHSDPETIPSVVADGTVIKIYYVKDDSQKVEVKYTVEYYIDGVKQENDTQVVTDRIWVNAEKKLNVRKNEINTTNKYVGYKFDHSEPETIPSVVADGTVIKIYYVKDDSQTVEVKYTVEYYKDGMLQENDTRVITDNVWVNDDKVLAVNVDEINTVNKYKGYSFKNTNPEIIPDVINDGGVIKVYYVRNSYPYIIYHVEKGNTENILGIQKGTKKYKDTVKVKECEYTGFTFDSKNKEEIVIDTDNNVAYVYYTRNVYSYNVEHYLEGLDGRFTLKETNEIKNVLYGSEIEYTPNNYAGYTYDSSMTYAPSKVENGEEVVRLYYRLNSSRVIVHYVVKVDDEYIPFTKAAYDKEGKLIANFEGVELEDAIITGKIGATFTTDLRVVYEYALNGIYEGNILTDANAKKLDGQTITSTIEIEEKEYTYVYEAPRGGDVPPQTGASILGYANYLLLLALIYLVKKYIEVK